MKAGDDLLLDNVIFHHSASVRDFADSIQAKLLFSPPYNPWFNPIEGMFPIVTGNDRSNMRFAEPFSTQ
ncbi:transposon [Cyanidioschyzon merolae strain 10D]|jgi:transposase|uniref:Transposon n=1 Tax=Cyanidioschyzon merolae (strain NIES-3377 / 10D) TaxID=280699 RepID=M1VH39_CYAM1|nr:transposon [Cyanidioschyzon merolae strain 10D]BAM82587.1 transposon [Cyanidioschyzon merolae strain 10D]|eukprot:XP_005538623.1 transposon [Cyanidioschyzon merolae strain 10D]